MKFFSVLAGLLPLAAALPAPQAGPLDLDSLLDVTNRYIVTLRDGADVQAATNVARSIQLRKRDLLAGVEKIYEGSFSGYAGIFDAATIEEIRNSEDVVAVEEDKLVTLDAITSQANPPYGLAAISNRTPRAGRYVYDDSAGEGGFAYIVDTGINDRHQDFGGRASLAYSAIPLLTPDTNGHGTHCAGTIGSATYGVSKRASLLGVKVFLGPTTLTSFILDGINWSVNDIVSKGRQGRSVISMSFGGGRSEAIDTVVTNGFNQGVTLVAAAGNSNEDAANSSPAGVPQIITVGATDINNAKAEYSSFGSVVDVFAPGTDVTSTWIGSTTATNTISGTSMACPHVAGLVLYLQRLEGITSPSAIAARIVELSTKNAISGMPAGTANRLAFNGAT